MKKKEQLNEKEIVTQEETPEEPIEEEAQPEEIGYESEHLANIETNRVVFLKFYHTHNVWKWIVGLAALVIILVDFLVFPNFFPENFNAGARFAILLVVAGFAIAGVGVYTVLVKKSVNKKMKQYFSDFYSEANNYLFEQEGFSDNQLQVPDKIEQIQFDENKVYLNVVNIGSRGLTNFRYHDKPMYICDCAAQTRIEKSVKPLFVGKYLVGDCSYKEADPIIIYIKGDERSLPPTNVEENSLVLNEKDLYIYSSNKDWNKTINSKLIKELHKIKPHDHLIDVTISLVNGKAYFLLGYDDPLMVLPLQNQFDAKPFMQLKKDIIPFVNLLEELDK